MHSISLLKIWLERNALIGHCSRRLALLRVVESLLSGARLALTHLGRHRAGDAFAKHRIKAVDRLLGNAHLHRERVSVYAALARHLLNSSARPLIVVDWADCELERELLILRASVPLGGRAFTLFEEVHPMRRYNSPGTHRRFLEKLHRIVPEHVRPIVVTDAGFRGPWFRAVEALGWDWIGGIRNTIKYYKARNRALVLRAFTLCRSNAKGEAHRGALSVQAPSLLVSAVPRPCLSSRPRKAEKA